jgi:hypothetical protein
VLSVVSPRMKPMKFEGKKPGLVSQSGAEHVAALEVKHTISTSLTETFDQSIIVASELRGV